MSDVRQRLKAVKAEKAKVMRLEAKLIAEIKKGRTYLSEALEYVRDRKRELILEEAHLLVLMKRASVSF